MEAGDPYPVCHRPVGDEHLVSIEHIIVGLALGARADLQMIARNIN